jgi:hypothetical protein
MKVLTRILFASSFLAFSPANALTVDEIIKLKHGGVSDETIQLLIRRDSEYRPSGTWKTKDGWIIHSTEMGGRHKTVDATYQNAYPIEVYPQIFPGQRWR